MTIGKYFKLHSNIIRLFLSLNNLTPDSLPTQMSVIFVPKNFSKQKCIFYRFTKTILTFLRFIFVLVRSFLQTMEIKGLQVLSISRPLQFGQIFLYSLSIWTLVTIQMVQCRHHEISNLQSSSNQQLGSEQISPLDTINDSKSLPLKVLNSNILLSFSVLIDKITKNKYIFSCIVTKCYRE